MCDKMLCKGNLNHHSEAIVSLIDMLQASENKKFDIWEKWDMYEPNQGFSMKLKSVVKSNTIF